MDEDVPEHSVRASMWREEIHGKAAECPANCRKDERTAGSWFVMLQGDCNWPQ